MYTHYLTTPNLPTNKLLKFFQEQNNKHSSDITSGVMLETAGVLTFWGSTLTGMCYLYN